MTEGDELLFFDTFAHANNEELNLDLVQFPKPVYLSQVRVVPLGAKVQANFPGGVRLGATNPSQFKLELFVNDLSKPGASAFETLGILDYSQNASIHFDCEKKVPTDGLVLRGWYTTVTLAVYGTISKGAIIPEQPVPKPVPEQPATPVTAETPPADQPSSTITPEEKPSTPATSEPPGQKLPEPDLVPPEEEKAKEEKTKDREEHEKEKDKEKTSGETKKDRMVKEKTKEGIREKDKKRDDKRRSEDKSRGRDAECRESESDSHESRDRDRERRKERDYRGRSREREYDKHRERSRSDRDRSRESNRRLRTPPAKSITVEKEEKDANKCISPGETEAISDDDMPEVDNALIAQNVGSVETDANEEEMKPEALEEKEPEAPFSAAEHTDAEGETEREELEEILSDEDIVFEEEYPDDIDMSEFGEEIGKPFNPYSFEVQPLQFLSCPSASPAEILAKKMKKGSLDHLKQGSDALSKLEELLQFPTRGDKWVELMDQAAELLPAALAYDSSQSGSKQVEEKILHWLFHGLDFEKALNQSPPVYIVRHLKAGLKLSSQVSASTDSLVRAAVDRGIVGKILTLYNAAHMALSLRLMCLRSLDSLLSWPVAVNRFLNDPLEGERNGYAYLVALLGKPQPTRAKVGIVALLKKLHHFEALQRIGRIARILAEAPVPLFRKSSFRRCSALSVESQDSNSQDGLLLQGSSESPLDPYMSELLACFTEVKKICKNPRVLIGQYLRFLPVKSQFELPAACDSTSTLFSYMKDQKFLQALTLFLTHPVTSSHQMVVSNVLEFLQFFLESRVGLLFLAADPGTTGLILKALLHGPGTPTEESRQEDDLHMEDLHPQNLASAYVKVGSQMAHSLQVIGCLDSLSAEVGAGLKESEILRRLHSLVFSAAGKQALINVITMGDNMDPLMSFLAPSQDVAAISSSAARGYAVEIVVLAVKFSTNVKFYQKYGPLLAGFIEQDRESKLGSLGPWLELSTNPSVFTYDGIPTLCDVVKQNADHVEQFPAPLIVALRLLCHLSIQEDDNNVVDEESYIELKYIYAIVHMFSSDMLSTLTGILAKVSQTYEHPTLHAATLAGSKGSLLMAVIHPCLKLVRAILSHVIHCRDKEFRDLTAIPILLQTYILVSVIPQSSPGYRLVQDCCSSIIATLLGFTQPVLQPEKVAGSSNLTSAEDAVARSLWTRMVQEIIQLILKTPASFVCGLQLLSELLPLPLPVPYNPKSIKPTDNDTQQVLNSRKLWSVHLHSLSPQIHEMISVLSCGGPQVFQHLRRVCIQIADLSPTTASVVSRSILDALMKCLNLGSAASGSKSEEKVESQIPSSLISSLVSARILNFLTSLVSHPPMKGSVLQLCRDLQKADEKYADVLQWLCVILNTSSSLPSHTQAQECVVSLFQTLLDPVICLLPADSAEMETYLSAALPCREQMQQMIIGLLDHLANADHSYSSLLPALRTLTMLTEQNYTFQVFQRVLEKKKHALCGLFNKLATAFSKDSSDCLSTLSTALELLRLLGTPGTCLHSRNSRTLTMSIPALSAALLWNSNENDEPEASKHPLLTLDALLKHHSSEDESLEGLRDSLNTVLELLQGSKDTRSKNEVADFNVPPPDSLASQFNSRLVFAPMAVEDERLSSSYWLSSQWVEEAETEPDSVRSDLLELSKTCLSDFDLMAELTRLCSSHVETFIDMQKHTVARSKTSSKSNISAGTTPGEAQPLQAIISTVKDKSNKPYVAPMRGRGFGRGGMTTRNDPFRSRVPNTSRPPSMHVDDFVALENNSNPYSRAREGTVPTRGRGGARARGFAADRTRYPARPAGRAPGPWEDYFPADERRFPASGRPWPVSKDRYAGPAPNTARNRHLRTFR